jgi:hypothetical protein
VVNPNENNISESLKDMGKFNNPRSGINKVQAVFLGKAYDSFYNKQSTYEESRVNASGNPRGEGFGKDEDDDLNSPIVKSKELGKGVKSKGKGIKRKSPKGKSLKGVKGFNKIFAIKEKRKNGSRQATRGDIRRAGISALKRANRSLARFIALRYSAKAIAKYQDYAGRLRRSKRLIKQIVKINDATFRIKGYIIRTDTAGNNPYSCTCPDFSQFSTDSRNWLGSKAGPFNPCKHMMAVRDRDKGGKWVCSDAVCTLDPNATEGYATKAECEAKIRPPFKGGQCAVDYIAGLSVDFLDKEGAVFSNRGQGTVARGPIIGFVIPKPDVEGQILYGVKTASGFVDFGLINTVMPSNPSQTKIASIQISRVDGLEDNCGDPPAICNVENFLGCTDPAANNYNPAANVNDGSCAYDVYGCTDPAANNYNPAANVNDGSCVYPPPVYGCTDPDAINYDPSATIDDGSCIYNIYGCTDPDAINYEPSATIDDGSCTY